MNMFTMREATLSAELPGLMAQVPELAALSTAQIAAHVGDADTLLVIAEAAGSAVGFKLGYALSPRVFYSWLGGVVPACRDQGVARSLLRLQENLVWERGYGELQVKSRNRFPAMLRLLIAEGYAVVGYEQGPHESLGDGKIVFGKRLHRPDA